MLDKIEKTINDVSDAVMSKKVLSEEPTLMTTRTLSMKLQRSLMNRLCSRETNDKRTCDSGSESGGQIILPDAEVLLKAVEKHVRDGQLVDSQVLDDILKITVMFHLK